MKADAKGKMLFALKIDDKKTIYRYMATRYIFHVQGSTKDPREENRAEILRAFQISGGVQTKSRIFVELEGQGSRGANEFYNSEDRNIYRRRERERERALFSQTKRHFSESI